jgi:hypothetical protein
MIKTKSNLFTYDFDEYDNALQKSLYDESWVFNLYKDKDNIYDIFKLISNNNYIKEASEFIREPSVKKLILAKSKKILDEKILSRICEAGKSEQNTEYVNEIKFITLVNAKKIEYLVNEFSENKRTFFECRLKPFPENISDTWKPIRSFKINYENNKTIISIEQNIINVKSEDKIICEYFNQRNIDKTIKRKYINLQDMMQEEFEFAKKYLLRSKECFINVEKLYNESFDNCYKTIYRGNQTVSTGEYEIPIFSNRILASHIMKI